MKRKLLCLVLSVFCVSLFAVESDIGLGITGQFVTEKYSLKTIVSTTDYTINTQGVGIVFDNSNLFYKKNKFGFGLYDFANFVFNVSGEASQYGSLTKKTLKTPVSFDSYSEFIFGIGPVFEYSFSKSVKNYVAAGFFLGSANFSQLNVNSVNTTNGIFITERVKLFGSEKLSLIAGVNFRFYLNDSVEYVDTGVSNNKKDYAGFSEYSLDPFISFCYNF